MKFTGQRKAISPIIATVLIIAVTLIAAVAIGGFVFGIFGSSSNSAQVQVTGIALVGATLAAGSGADGSPGCATGAAANSITLTNTGTAAAAATSMSITYGGAVYTFAITGACTVTPAGLASGNPMTITMAATDLVTGATSGASYTGTVTMSNGAILVFAGTFI
jgi:flagellin-like protein